MSSGEMKSPGLPVDGDDHPHRDPVFFSGHQFSHTDRNQFLSGRDVAGNNVPVAEHIYLQTVGIEQFPHIQQRNLTTKWGGASRVGSQAEKGDGEWQ